MTVVSVLQPDVPPHHTAGRSIKQRPVPVSQTGHAPQHTTQHPVPAPGYLGGAICRRWGHVNKTKATPGWQGRPQNFPNIGWILRLTCWCWWTIPPWVFEYSYFSGVLGPVAVMGPHFQTLSKQPHAQLCDRNKDQSRFTFLFSPPLAAVSLADKSFNLCPCSRLLQLGSVLDKGNKFLACTYHLSCDNLKTGEKNKK